VITVGRREELTVAPLVRDCVRCGIATQTARQQLPAPFENRMGCRSDVRVDPLQIAQYVEVQGTGLDALDNGEIGLNSRKDCLLPLATDQKISQPGLHAIFRDCNEMNNNACNTEGAPELQGGAGNRMIGPIARQRRNRHRL
jgi:hypothetical protein